MQMYFIGKKDRENYNYQKSSAISIKLSINDKFIEPENNLISIENSHYKKPKYNFTIDIVNNQIINGEDFLNKITINGGRINKKCKTCKMSVNTYFSSIGVKKMKIIPPINGYVEMEYMMPKFNKVLILGNSNASPLIDIYSNNKVLITNFPLDFSKFNNLKQLNNRIKTIITFQ